MLMKDNKKSAITLIVNKAKGPNHLDNMKPEFEKAPMKDGAEQDSSIPEDSAAEELLQAIEQKSPKAIVEAFKALMGICDMPEESED